MPAGLAGIDAVEGGSRVRALVPVQAQAMLPVRALLPAGFHPTGTPRSSGRILLRKE